MIDHSKIEERRRQDMEFLNSLETDGYYGKKIGAWRLCRLCSECHRCLEINFFIRFFVLDVSCASCGHVFRYHYGYIGSRRWIGEGRWWQFWKGYWEYRTKRGIERRDSNV